MKCYICDHTLSDQEVSWNNDCQQWEPCSSCLIAISEVFEDKLTEEEIDEALAYELFNYYGGDE